MGVRGLQSFINNHNILKNFVLERGSELVVDGSAFIRALHEDNTARFGGEYAKFMGECECFFSNMKSLGIKMCIIFDGAMDENKYDLIQKRHLRRITRLAHLSWGEEEEKGSG